MTPRPFPENAEDARRDIHALLREKCPNGFQKIEEREKLRALSARVKNKIKRIAAAFPEALGALDIDGRNALHWAARYDAPELIQFMLDAGVNPGPDQRAHHLPLSEAAALNHGPALDLLIDATGVDARGSLLRSTALMEASYCGNEPAMRQLLARGADPSLASSQGDTPLHLLCVGKKDEPRAMACLALLLDARAPILDLNRKGQTPADVAEEHGSPLAGPLRSLMERLAIAPEAHPGKPARGPSL